LTGATTVSGTLQVQKRRGLERSTALTLNNGSTLQLRADADTTFTPPALPTSAARAHQCGSITTAVATADTRSRWRQLHDERQFDVECDAGSGDTLA